jgi:hypothetical protein
MRRTVWALSLGLVMGGAAALNAQDPRDAMVARAFNEFDTQRRLQLLVAALNPTAGPPRGAWPVGVQLLAQTLLEDGRDSLAGAWLRWAVRLSPDLQPDTVQFLPRVADAYRAARGFVNRTRSRTDSLAQTTWLWSGQESGDAQGRIQVAATGAPLRVEIRGVGVVGPGGSVPLTAGSYDIGVTAAGFDSVHITREVLPGVTTVVDFRPLARPTTLAAQPAQRPVVTPAAPPRAAPPPAAPARQPVAQQKKKFPVMWVAIGGAAVLGAALLLGGGGDGNGASTGGITITFPNP